MSATSLHGKDSTLLMDEFNLQAFFKTFSFKRSKKAEETSVFGITDRTFAPGTQGGANYAPISYSPRTGLLYVNAVDAPYNAGRPAKGYFSAYDPTTGELKWRQTFEGWGQAGSVVTAGDLVFAGTGSNTAGYFFAFDARTGDLLWKYNTGAGVFSSPSTYMVNGEQFVTVASGGGDRGRRGGDLILSFALPPR